MSTYYTTYYAPVFLPIYLRIDMDTVNDADMAPIVKYKVYKLQIQIGCRYEKIDRNPYYEI